MAKISKKVREKFKEYERKLADKSINIQPPQRDSRKAQANK